MDGITVKRLPLTGAQQFYNGQFSFKAKINIQILPWQCLNFLPLPQGQRAFLGTFHQVAGLFGSILPLKFLTMGREALLLRLGSTGESDLSYSVAMSLFLPDWEDCST